MPQQKKAYSYTRFSTPEQARGDSARRQLAAAEDYARRHNLVLDDSLTFRDSGVSGFRGRNLQDGRLGDFLELVEKGAIPQGSYLLVENLDRISRQAARKALRTLERIVEAGITLVTTTDGKAYTEQTLDEDPMALTMVLLTFIRAHEESQLKGRRVRAAWDNKRQRAVAEGTPLTKRTPAWLVLGANGKLRLHPKRAAIVARIFKMAAKGMGQHAIAQALNREKIAAFNSDMWHRSYVKKLLANPATMGRLVAHRIEYTNNRKVRTPVVEVDGHFPAAVTASLWQRVQEMKDTGASSGTRARPAPMGQAAVKNMLAGLARCPLCLGTMTRVNKGPDGGFVYLICAKAKAGAGCFYKAVRLAGVEDAIKEHWSYLLGTAPSGDDEADRRLEQVDEGLSMLAEQAARVTEAISLRGLTGTLGDRLQSIEADMSELEAERKALLAKIEDAPLLTMKIEELEKVISVEKPDNQRVNALLRQMVRSVVVDYNYGSLIFDWRHGGESRVTYAWADQPMPGGR